MKVQHFSREGVVGCLSMIVFLVAPILIAQEDAPAPTAANFVVEAQNLRAKGDFAGAAAAIAQAIEQAPNNSDLRQSAGVLYFFAGNPTASVKHFDAYLEMVPKRVPYHWQRGISHYYAGLFAEGQKQFEVHQTVNGSDVENSAWHFLCVASKDGVDVAREKLIPVTGDQRVPMAEVLAMFEGRFTPERVIRAAGKDAEALCYAHLYIGLYLEVTGDLEGSLKHIRLAAKNYAQPHYMGEVARVHLKLRSKKGAEDKETTKGKKKPAGELQIPNAPKAGDPKK